MFVHHLKSLEEETLAKMIYNEQRQHNWPGLFKETTQLCKDLNVEDVNNTNMSKNQYRQLFTSACKIKHEQNLREGSEGKVKTERIFKSKYGMKRYFESNNIMEARNIFRTRTMMMPFAANYSRNMKYKKTNWLCKCTWRREEEAHLMGGKCPVYSDIWERFNNLEEDEVLARFFGEVLARTQPGSEKIKSVR